MAEWDTMVGRGARIVESQVARGQWHTASRRGECGWDRLTRKLRASPPPNLSSVDFRRPPPKAGEGFRRRPCMRMYSLKLVLVY